MWLFIQKNENTGTRASPEEQLNITLAWDRADVAKDNIVVYGQQWQVQLWFYSQD